MSIKLTIALGSIFLTACNTNREKNIYGTWTSIDNTGMNVTDEMRFEKDGNFQLTMYANGDSILRQMNGTYEIDQLGKTIKVAAMGETIEHQIINLRNDTLELLTSQNVKMRMVKK